MGSFFFEKALFPIANFQKLNAYLKMHKLSYSGNEACSRSKKPFSSPGEVQAREKKSFP